MVLKHLKRQLIHNFRSDADKLLDHLNQTQEDTLSIQFEVEKHAKLHATRDHKAAAAPSIDDKWKDF